MCLTRVPVVSIALIRGRATGNGSEITLACDMSFASGEKAILSQWEVGVGMVAGGGPMGSCIASLGRPAAQDGIKALMARGFHKPGDVENRLGYYVGQIAR